MVNHTHPPGGYGVARRNRAARPLRSRQISPYEPEKKTEPITVAVVDFLADLRLSGSERVLGALALAIAEGMDASPPYAKGRLAHELREILMELSKAELSPENLSLLEGVEL
jgi:hypothetical protein